MWDFSLENRAAISSLVSCLAKSALFLPMPGKFSGKPSMWNTVSFKVREGRAEKGRDEEG